MRKISKLLIVLFTFAFGINIVNADNCENISMTAEADANGYPFVRDSIKMKWSTNSEGEGRLLTFKDSTGKQLPSYCHNVSKPTGARYGTTKFVCTKEIFDSTKKLTQADIRNIYDAGLMKILVNGYNLNNTSSGVVGYTATDLAVKTYELLFPESVNTNNMNSGEKKEYLKAYYYFANKMLDDNDISTLVKEATGSLNGKYTDAIEYTWASNSEQIETRAKELLKIGLNAAKDFKRNGAASITWNSNPVVTKDLTTENNNVTNYSGSIEYTFKINNFTSNGAEANVSFNCEDCNANGVNYTVSVNGENYTGPIDLLSKVTNGSGEVTVKVSFSTTSRTYNCEDLDYKFIIDYKDTTIANEAYEMRSTDHSCSGNACQPIYVLRNTNITKQATIEDSFAMCTLTCEELKTKCDSGNSKSCTEYHKQYPKGCVNCGVGIKNNECADPGSTSTLDLIEGYEIDSVNCTQSTEENITGCILENKDAAGNSYEYLNNGLCSVSCKEDFHFTLPGNLNVASGRYLNPLKTDIKATKTCYLKVNGDPTSVLSNFEKGAQETQNNYPTCAKAKAIEKLTVADFKESTKETVSCGEQQVRKTRKPYQGYSDKDECMEHGFSDKECSSERYYYVKEEQKTTVTTYVAEINIDGGCCKTCGGHEYIKIVPEVEYINGTCQVSGSIENAIMEKVNSLKSNTANACEAINNLNAKGSLSTYDVPDVGGVKAYVYGGTYSVYTGGSADSIYKGIGAYNACSLWEMNYDFNPDLYFNYEESYMKDALTDKLELVGDITKGDTTHYYCTSDDGDSSYKSCRGGWKTTPQFTSRNYCVCTSDGCENTPIAVNNTRRMKESITYNASYITPTQFYTIYPTGAVVVAPDGSKIENATELTNALPVGLGTPAGTRHYVLYAKNLGEYYGSGKIGRVWGDKNSVVSITLKQNNDCVNNGALKYDTNLNGTYIDKGVWECNYCVDCNSPQEKVCKKTDGTIVDMTSCLVNKSEEECKKELCNCPDCPPIVEYPDPDACKIINGKYYGKYKTEVDYKTFKIQCCPDSGCPVTLVGGKNFSYRPVSTGDLNPGKRTMGPNWYYDKDSISTALEMKAYVTTNEILLDGETIYDENSDKYVMKVKLDSAMINKVKSRADKDYASNTLECYDYTQDGKTYNNIFCYSKYIDELLSDPKTKEKITFAKERPLTESERKNSQNSEYWTTWTKSLANGRWDITTTKTLSYFSSNYGEINIGPSWK